MDTAVGQALDVSLDPLDVGRERSQHRLDLAASERAVQLLDLLEVGHVGNTKPSRPLCAKAKPEGVIGSASSSAPVTTQCRSPSTLVTGAQPHGPRLRRTLHGWSAV